MRTTLLSLFLFLFLIPFNGIAVDTRNKPAVTATAAPSEEKLTILTNPVKDGQLKIKYLGTEGQSFNLTIVNSLGEQVYNVKRNASRQELSFDISKLAAGIYFLRVNTEDSSTVKKLIVQ